MWPEVCTVIILVGNSREQFSACHGKEREERKKTANKMSVSVSHCVSNLKCYPWLEADASTAGYMVALYAQLTDTLHHKFRGGSLAVLCSHMYECL